MLLVAYLILRGKVLTVRAVRQPIFGDPLRMLLSALYAYFGYFSNFPKVHLNPLPFIVCPGRPCTCAAPSSPVVDPGIVRPMIGGPLVFNTRVTNKSKLQFLILKKSSSRSKFRGEGGPRSGFPPPPEFYIQFERGERGRMTFLDPPLSGVIVTHDYDVSNVRVSLLRYSHTL